MPNGLNLGLTMIQGSDLVDPQVINNNFIKVDDALVDYVVEESTVGEWWYRQWNSGRMECGVDSKSFGSFGATNMHPWGDSKIQGIQVYSTSAMRFDRYPKTFVSRPHVIITHQDETGVGKGLMGYVKLGSTSNQGTSQPPNFAYMSLDSTPLTNSYFSIYAIGRWK